MNPTLTNAPDYYDERLIAHFSLVFGEGFLSPGGAPEVREIVRGLDLRHSHILDIGCGVGGPAMVLAAELGAAQVISIDIQPQQVERATRHVAQAGLAGRVRPTLVTPGPLPFDDNSFDFVFSKEAINEVSDKPALFREIFRVLKPGSWLAVGDWLKGDGELSELFYTWERSMNLPLQFERISNIAPVLAQCGFTQITITPRSQWYRQQAHAEMLRSMGPLRESLFAIQQDERLMTLAFKYWRTMLQLLDSGEFIPAHFRAQKP
jgi:ubiquinone/menaquinone biosynthesis C-methylase UbiE